MKNIIICCDGTGNEYGRNNTNVVETYTIVEKDQTQIAYYDPGVGTGDWEYHDETGDLRAKGDQATGWGLQKMWKTPTASLCSVIKPVTASTYSALAAAHSQSAPLSGCSTSAVY